ncbi:HAT, C-terminal dimerization domain containing protein [Parasponia andersonii]|uniref:HAT, C-terminal dimerization domain containing protein n=1 Tax=Parasponia andersonii TaxID=3476 RepID=A0A2P5B7Y9_PARAD|nr:HAT, C-terminal dimerization domain containing protein [Parasponia andersonii]
MTAIKSCITKLVNHYAINEFKAQQSDNSQAVGSSSQEKISVIDSDDKYSFDLESEFDKECVEDESLDLKNEFDRYLAECVEDRKNSNFDILEWWKVTSSKFPVLGAIARDVLAIQVSTVASESAFSTRGRVLDCFRSSLSSTMAEVLICCQNWLRSKSLPLDLTLILEEIATYESVESETSTLTSEVVNLN